MISVNVKHKQPFHGHKFTYMYLNHGTGMVDLGLDVRCAYSNEALRKKLLVA